MWSSEFLTLEIYYIRSLISCPLPFHHRSSYKRRYMGIIFYLFILLCHILWFTKSPITVNFSQMFIFFLHNATAIIIVQISKILELEYYLKDTAIYRSFITHSPYLKSSLTYFLYSKHTHTRTHFPFSLLVLPMPVYPCYSIPVCFSHLSQFILFFDTLNLICETIGFTSIH